MYEIVPDTPYSETYVRFEGDLPSANGPYRQQLDNIGSLTTEPTEFEETNVGTKKPTRAKPKKQSAETLSPKEAAA